MSRIDFATSTFSPKERRLDDTILQVKYSYLDQQFTEIDSRLEAIRSLVRTGDFTLGEPVAQFEARFAELQGARFAIGVNSGTDAIALSLMALGIGHGDEVITAPNTFIATVGAIVQVGARPIFVDVRDDYQINARLIEPAITGRTKALLPVHYCGRPAEMPAIMDIATRYRLHVVEDAAQAINGAINGQPVGNFGSAGCFSLHPLKNLNVWGDGGIIVTNSEELRDRLRLLRNHGLATRDDVLIFGVNSRLDSLQALIGLSLIADTLAITDARIANAQRYDAAFSELPYITVPPRDPRVREVYHTYVLQVEDRDDLLAHLVKCGVEAKIHYPIPVHLQPAARYLGYKHGDFPVTEAQAGRIITLPVHQHLTREQVDYVIGRVWQFYGAR
jgi:dTDP-4-amino-4,6-dideoxygalactose transaminase